MSIHGKLHCTNKEIAEIWQHGNIEVGQDKKHKRSDNQTGGKQFSLARISNPLYLKVKLKV